MVKLIFWVFQLLFGVFLTVYGRLMPIGIRGSTEMTNPRSLMDFG